MSVSVDRASGQSKRVAGFQLDGPFGKGSDTNLGAGEVLEDGHGDVEVIGNAAYAFDDLSVILMASVREVESGNVHSGSNQSAKLLFGRGRGSDRTNDLGSSVRTGGRVFRRHMYASLPHGDSNVRGTPIQG